jgi:hypothetical protein
MTEVSRRTVLMGVAATAATTAFGSATVPLSALAQAKPGAGEIPEADMKAFVGLSEKLTGIPAAKLAPGVDPIDVASVYFSICSSDPSFKGLLKSSGPDPTMETVANLVKNPEYAYLCRSIILAWYLGAWYEPETLKAEASGGENAVANKPLAATGKPTAKRYNQVKCRVISPKTYSQGWVWRIAQAHPMGYANLQFGYWGETPTAVEKFIS